MKCFIYLLPVKEIAKQAKRKNLIEAAIFQKMKEKFFDEMFTKGPARLENSKLIMREIYINFSSV